MPTLQMCIYEIQQTKENSTNDAYRRDKTSKDSKRVHLSSLHVDNKRRFEIKVVVLYIYISLIIVPTLYVSITIFMDKNRSESVKPKVSRILKPNMCSAILGLNAFKVII